ncbi:hypothetical protein SESBI_43905 [Sesbania bispinosa]|nr:hypothetical protein SESBI_43905 [Sesbania bispinosa]
MPAIAAKRRLRSHSPPTPKSPCRCTAATAYSSVTESKIGADGNKAQSLEPTAVKPHWNPKGEIRLFL